MRPTTWSFLLILLAGCASGAPDGFDVGQDEPAASIGGTGGSGDGATGGSGDVGSGGDAGSGASVATTGAGGAPCEPTTYEKSSGFGSGSVTTCCDAGDELVAVIDCGEGMNHGVKQEGACGVGYEGAMNGGSPCVTVTCATGCGSSTTSSASSSASSSSSSAASSGSGGSDPGSCAHEKCAEGEPLDPACDPCVASICADDAYCCDTSGGAWDDLCIEAVTTICGESC